MEELRLEQAEVTFLYELGTLPDGTRTQRPLNAAYLKFGGTAQDRQWVTTLWDNRPGIPADGKGVYRAYAEFHEDKPFPAVRFDGTGSPGCPTGLHHFNSVR